jgi:hypothetical protein
LKSIAIVDDLSKAKELGLSSLDFVQIYNYGIPFENVCGQLNKFKKDFKNDAGRARKGL